MSCWYVTPVCLLAHSEIGDCGGEPGRTAAFLPYGSSPVSSAVCQTDHSECSPETSGRVVEEVLFSTKAVERLSLPLGSGNRAVCPWTESLPQLHAWVGWIRGRPAGAHSLQLWSAAARPNTRQHLQPSALKRPKNSDWGTQGMLACWCTGQNCVSSCTGAFKCHRSSGALTDLFYKGIVSREVILRLFFIFFNVNLVITKRYHQLGVF